MCGGFCQGCHCGGACLWMLERFRFSIWKTELKFTGFVHAIWGLCFHYFVLFFSNYNLDSPFSNIFQQIHCRIFQRVSLSTGIASDVVKVPGSSIFCQKIFNSQSWWPSSKTSEFFTP